MPRTKKIVTKADEVIALLDPDDQAFVRDIQRATVRAANIVSPEQQKLIDEVSELYAQGQLPSIRDGLHISDVLGRDYCVRSAILKHFYKQNTVFHSARQSAIFDSGTDFHNRWEGNLSRSVPNYAVELKHIETFWKLIFTPDFIGDFRGKPTVWEFKGYGSSYFNKLVGRKNRYEAIQEKPLPKEAIIQNQLYQWFTGIHQGLVVVENKDTQEICCWLLHYDPSLLDGYPDDFDYIKRLCDIHQETERLPKRLLECADPMGEKPQTCGACNSCFATRGQRVLMRRPKAWE